MKKISFILLIGISISLLSCHKGGEKTEKVDVRTYQLSEKSQTGEYAMQQSSAKGEAKIGGVEYQYEIDRNPSPQLPKVKDEQNNLFVDNVIDLRIIRNGKSIYEKGFFFACGSCFCCQIYFGRVGLRPNSKWQTPFCCQRMRPTNRFVCTLVRVGFYGWEGVYRKG